LGLESENPQLKTSKPETRIEIVFSSQLDYQKLNLLSLVCSPGVVLNIILLDVGLNGVVESRLI